MRQRSNLIILFGVAFFLIGGAIVFLVLGDDDGGGSSSSGQVAGPSEITVFVAAQEIPANTLGSDVIEQGLLRAEQVPVGSQPVGAIASAGSLDNQIFVVAVAEGDVITSAQLSIRSLSNINIPEGFDGVALTLDFNNGGAGYIAPGDLINIYGLLGTSDTAAGLTTAPNEGAPRTPRTELLLTNVLVLDVSTQAGTSFQNNSQTQANPSTAPSRASGSSLTFLLAMKPTDIERLVQTSTFADLYFSLTADDAPPVGDTPGSDAGTVTGPVSADSAAPVEG